MPACLATLDPHERQLLRALYSRESQIIDQCNAYVSQFSDMMNDLQCIHHASDSDDRELKCDEFIRVRASRIECDTFNYVMVPGAVQVAMTCECICIQAACFRILYKWIPQLDRMRMKVLKIKNMCTKPGSKTGIEICASIEKTITRIISAQSQNRRSLKTTSHSHV